MLALTEKWGNEMVARTLRAALWLQGCTEKWGDKMVVRRLSIALDASSRQPISKYRSAAKRAIEAQCARPPKGTERTVQIYVAKFAAVFPKL